MEKKNLFVAPEVEVVIFPEQDIVTTSNESQGAIVTSNGIELPEDELD